MVSEGVASKVCMSVKLPKSSEAHIKAMEVGLEAANAILTSLLCTNPMLPLLATFTIFKAALNSESMAPKDKE